MIHFFIIDVYILFSLLFSGSGDLLKESFSYPDGPLPGHFWSEGCAGVIKNGKLFIDADTTGPRASSVWLNKELEGDLGIEFDVNLVSSSDDANNINVFFMYKDPSGKPLKQTAAQREDGLYSRYHQLQGYIFTNVTNGDTTDIRYRFRKNPGFKLVSQAQSARKNRKQKIHIKILKKGNHFEYWEDEQKLFDLTSDDVAHQYNSGLFGFRTWHTAIEIDNLLIKKL
ncbi:MAG TPA: DUF6250 domain-containing protein [Niabella sp.]|nr:DUF6250 domain-containing protein [Niabella sp.]